MDKNVWNVIERIKEDMGNWQESYAGHCLRTFCRLYRSFPSARMYYNSEHVLTMINGKLYDRFGVYDDVPAGYLPAKGNFSYKFFRRAFREIKMGRADWISLKKYFDYDTC